jgi:putative intracellular protease/amidase
VKDTNGEFFIKGKEITGFSNSEEDAVQLREVVPFMLEDEIVNRNAQYQSGADWHPFAIQDGLAITGQNPASSELAAEKLLTFLAK